MATQTTVDALRKLLQDLADEMQAASSMGGEIGQTWLDKRIRRIRKLLAK